MERKVIVWDSIFGCKVNNMLYQQQIPSKALAVLFPGRGYTCVKPLLHYAAMAAMEHGMDVLCLEYGFYQAGAEFTASDIAPFASELCGILRAAGAQDYPELFFISKSLGTVLAGEVAQGFQKQTIHQLFLTPVERTLPFLLRASAYTILGTADDAFPAHCLEQVRGLGHCKITLIPNADHSLETGEGVEKNLAIMREIATVYHSFLKQE